MGQVSAGRNDEAMYKGLESFGARLMLGVLLSIICALSLYGQKSRKWHKLWGLEKIA